MIEYPKLISWSYCKRQWHRK